jgi:hypothetical protein
MQSASALEFWGELQHTDAIVAGIVAPCEQEAVLEPKGHVVHHSQLRRRQESREFFRQPCTVVFPSAMRIAPMIGRLVLIAPRRALEEVAAALSEGEGRVAHFASSAVCMAATQRRYAACFGRADQCLREDYMVCCCSCDLRVVDKIRWPSRSPSRIPPRNQRPTLQPLRRKQIHLRNRYAPLGQIYI